MNYSITQQATRNLEERVSTLEGTSQSHEDRIKAIVDAMSHVSESELTDKGQPKVSRMRELVNFKVSAAEIDTAMAQLPQAPQWKQAEEEPGA